MRALAVALALGAAALAPPAARAQPDLGAEIEALRAELAERPGDVDARLRLAFRLSWAGQAEAARSEALRVVEAAPRYWDAHVLIARVDAWQKRYADARARLAEVLAAAPELRAARLLAADVEIWARRPEAARALLAPLPDDDPEALYRRALIARLRGNPWAVHRFAGALAASAPDDARAQRLLDDSTRLRAAGGLELEIFPDAMPADRLAYAAITGLGVFVTGDWSAGFGYEYRRRFSTDNHRVWLRSDWRASRSLGLMAFVRAGIVEVVPAITGIAQLEWAPSPALALRGRYVYDKMPWPGHLHRADLAADVLVRGSLHAELGATGGVLAHCGERDLVGAGRGGLRWQRPRWWLRGEYAYGVELERPVLPGYLDGDAGAAFCDGPGAFFDLVDVRAHQLAATFSWQIAPKLALRLGYAFQRRPTTAAHMSAVGVTVGW